MKAITTVIPDVIIFEPKVFGDERGFLWKALINALLKMLWAERLTLSRQPFKIYERRIARLALSDRTLCAGKVSQMCIW